MLHYHLRERMYNNRNLKNTSEKLMYIFLRRTISGSSKLLSCPLYWAIQWLTSYFFLIFLWLRLFLLVGAVVVAMIVLFIHMVACQQKDLIKNDNYAIMNHIQLIPFLCLYHTNLTTLCRYLTWYNKQKTK